MCVVISVMHSEVTDVFASQTWAIVVATTTTTTEEAAVVEITTKVVTEVATRTAAAVDLEVATNKTVGRQEGRV